MFHYLKNNDALGTANRGIPCESGLCTLCVADCKGKCEIWLASLVGRKLLYPRSFGKSTSGSANITQTGVGYHALRIQGYAYGSHGVPEGLTDDPDDCIFPNVSIETEFGAEQITRCRIPIMTGALGSTFIAADYWEPFAVGAALCGFPIVIGENVVGVDQESVIQKGRVVSSPEMDRRIDSFLRYYDGYGAIIVQLNVEDTRNGVAEYLAEKYGNKVIIELKWGQGAKDIGGEIQVTTLEYALFLKERGYIVDPDPTNPVIQNGFKHRAIRAFARHSRLGATNLASSAQVRDDFMKSVAYLRTLGFKKISLKTGAYGMEALAMSIRLSSDADLDLLTIDGAGGGTGMSPWNMMDHWGVPSLQLHAKTYEYCKLLDDIGNRVPDISLAGGFAREDHLFKALALCAPYAKLVCMGRAPMIPGFLGSNIQGVFQPEKRAQLNGHWDELPPSVKNIGTFPEEIFAGWEAVKNKIGADEMSKIPFGAIAMFGYADKLSCGLQQFMAGARKFSLNQISRKDLMASNRETAQESDIPFMTDIDDSTAKNIIKGQF
ncbi:MAG: FMN-binding glutamate synthase family protein [Deltaproteobacteria bacterium]|nr:FMN-binding glutamate synthase family protein [Deltaproteobacteria bacterium]MBW2478043.1 FMN-binding glutamate synthase family protein [Deltaproteobacteria bacterium]MBW2503415.1 FMN-binding glutamate synthase family protein [Deltaproteobacteria bacterium]MBW2519212.1 FMN-binding glutamate synthase family protein [Deltaproteobacteria bacterium]